MPEHKPTKPEEKSISPGVDDPADERVDLHSKSSRAPKAIRHVWKSLKEHHEIGTLIATWIGLGLAIWLAAHQNTLTQKMAVEQNEVAHQLATQQNFMLFYEQWESETMQLRRARLASALSESETPNTLDDTPLVFFETLGNATKRGLVDHELAWTTFYVNVVSYWAASEKYVMRTRAEEKCKCFFEELERLAQDFEETARRKGEGASIVGKDPDSIRRFLNWELNLAAHQTIKN